jgi:hypothetical protein
MTYIVEILGFVLILLKVTDYIDLEWKIVLMPWAMAICGRILVTILTRRNR